MINKHYLKANFCPKTKITFSFFWQKSSVNPLKISQYRYIYSPRVLFFLTDDQFFSFLADSMSNRNTFLFTVRLGYWSIDWIYDWMNDLSWLYSLGGSHVCASLFVRLFTVNFRMNLKSQVTQSHYFCYVRVWCSLSKYGEHMGRSLGLEIC